MTPEQKEQLPELLRLAALALGDGWEKLGNVLYKKGHGYLDPLWDGDSQWLACELLISITFLEGGTLAWENDADSHCSVYELHENRGNRQAATCWAVLRCCAETGRMKEKAK